MKVLGQIALLARHIPEAAVHGVLLFVVCIIGVSFWAERESSETSNRFLVGSQLSMDLEPEVIPNRAIVVALSPTCVYCIESMPFYRKIGNMTDETRGIGLDVKLIVITANTVDVESLKYQLLENQVRYDTLIVRPIDQIDIVATPTI